MADPDFVKGASGPSNVYDTSPTGLGLSPAYLAPGAVASATSAGGGSALSQIFDYTASGSVASIDSNTVLGGNLPATYNHLLVEFQVAGDGSTGALWIRVNNDSGANYDVQEVEGLGSSALTAELTGQTKIILPTPGTGAPNSLAGTIVIQNYLNTSFNKVGTFNGSNKIGTGASSMRAGQRSFSWNSTSAITRIAFLPDAGNLTVGSRVTLYGML